VNHKQPRAVFIQFTAKPSGSPISGLMVVDALREAGYEVHTVFAGMGELAEDYRRRCATVRELEHGRWLAGGPWHRRFRRLLREFRAANRFERLFEQIGPKLVYVNNLTGLAPALAARRRRIACVWHIRELFDDVGGEMHPPWPGGRHRVRRYLRSCASHIVAISRAVEQNVVDGCCRDKTTIIPNAVDDAFFAESRTPAEARQLFSLPPEQPLVGVPGTLRPVKGHEFFLEAAAQVAKAMPEVLFAITGDGEPPYREKLSQRVNQLGLTNRIRFLGTVADMPAFYRACDVICIPSRSESFGRTAVEAMAVGTPVVATAVGGLAETIQNGHTGLLVTYGEPTLLAERLLHVLQDCEARRQLAHAALAVASKYSVLHYKQHLFESLERIIPKLVHES